MVAIVTKSQIFLHALLMVTCLKLITASQEELIFNLAKYTVHLLAACVALLGYLNVPRYSN